MTRRTDLERARELGMTVESFRELVGEDAQDAYPQFTRGALYGPSGNTKGPKDKKKKDKKSESGMGLKDPFSEIPSEHVPFETDEDVRNKTALEMEHYWDHPVESDADKALYYGFHVHGKDNVYGLHAHYPGGPLGGGHKHGPQNLLGYHTHRYGAEELLQFKFARPGIMIELDGPHNHQHNAPDGGHNHAEENFGPASDERDAELKERNSKVDKV